MIRRTHLSKKPAAGSAWAAAYGVAAFMLFYLFYHQDLLGLSRWVASTPAQVFGRHEYWRAFTSLAVHADLEHLLSNSLFFAGLSYLLYGYFGAWVFPVASVAAGALIQALSLATYRPEVTLVGASGVVYFMAAFWLAMYVGIERGLPLVRRIVNATGFTLILLMPETFKPRVSYRAHAIGFGVGLVLGALYFALRRKELRAAEEVDAPSRPELRAISDFETRLGALAIEEGRRRYGLHLVEGGWDRAPELFDLRGRKVADHSAEPSAWTGRRPVGRAACEGEWGRCSGAGG